MSVNSILYFDNNATTRLAEEAREAMLPFLGELYGNPSSAHTFGGRAKAHIDRAREQVAALLGADPEEILFTSGATESNNLALFGVMEAQPKKRHLVTTQVEHPSVKNPAAHIERQPGAQVTWLDVDEEGRLDLEALRAAVRPGDTALVSIMAANNETGVVFPFEEAARIAKERGAIVHVDAVQAAGKIPIRLRDSAIDLLSISAHKFHGPKGVGALFVRRGTRLRARILGGHQERNRRGGTENVAGIAGMGAAAELARRRVEAGAESGRMTALRDRLEREILARIPEARVNGGGAPRLPNTSNISFRYVQGEAALLALDELGICVSTGSACATGQVEPSHVLRAMNVPYTYLIGSLRFSLSAYTADAEITRLIEVLPDAIARLRALSPFSGSTDEPAALQAARAVNVLDSTPRLEK